MNCTNIAFNFAASVGVLKQSLHVLSFVMINVILWRKDMNKIIFPSQAEDADEVYDLILRTKHHKTDAHTTPGAYGQDDLHFFLDFDMAVLGRDPVSYRTYAEQIRQEYIHIPEEMFNKGRRQVSEFQSPRMF
jgi:predicted metal-dependent HD superfamily phosphohydrolase